MPLFSIALRMIPIYHDTIILSLSCHFQVIEKTQISLDCIWNKCPISNLWQTFKRQKVEGRNVEWTKGRSGWMDKRWEGQNVNMDHMSKQKECSVAFIWQLSSFSVRLLKAWVWFLALLNIQLRLNNPKSRMATHVLQVCESINYSSNNCPFIEKLLRLAALASIQ